jgi:glycogen debranching enzyme
MDKESRIQIDGRWYVLATAARGEEQPQALKRDEVFALFDRYGDVAPWEGGDQGLFVNDTRYLSRLELLIEGVRPLQLNAVVRDDGSVLAVELMNPDVQRDGVVVVQRGTVHMLRRKLLWQGSCFEQLELTNYGPDPVEFDLDLHLAADFVDVFEIRGAHRVRRGRALPACIEEGALILGYDGLDGFRRRTIFRFDPAPTRLEPDVARFAVRMAPGEQRRLSWQIVCDQPPKALPTATSYDVALEGHLKQLAATSAQRARLSSSNPLMDRWLQRSMSDLDMLTTELPTGPYPYAGVPWFCTTFGRDALITSFLCLWLRPDLARGTLAFLAETQARSLDPTTDAEPGKILHEARIGEMAATKEVPFARYYGSVDSTPIFVMLAAAYWRRTGDVEFARSLWPNIKLALQWVEQFGDSDGDGLIEYARASDNGLIQQGWKDSHDSVFHADGEDVKAPVALCEVQGYVYAAKVGAAEIAEMLGETTFASKWRVEADALKRQFQQKFWCEDLGMYALALDARKRPCRVASSNAGHALWCGIASPEHARRIAERMMDPDMFSGWGVRTLASHQSRYNPMSYHNGSIWPHDNALICEGLARYGHMDAALAVFTAAFDCSLHFDGGRLPELFSGFPRRPGEGPTRYPVACSPQAWATAAVYGMLGGCLRIEADARDPCVRLHTPRLPNFLEWLRIDDLMVAGKRVDLLFQRYDGGASVEVLRREGGIPVSVVV